LETGERGPRNAAVARRPSGRCDSPHPAPALLPGRERNSRADPRDPRPVARANPAWSYSFWDAERAEAFIAEAYGLDVLARYRRIRPEYHAARSDLLRYLALYRLGGVYLDIKSSCRVPLDEALRPEDRFLLMHWDLGQIVPHAELSHVAQGEYLQWCIATVPGHPYLREVIDRVLRNIDHYAPWRSGTGRWGTLRLTGPVAYTLAIEPVRECHPHTYIADPAARGFVYSDLPGAEVHRELFGREKHYTALEAPIVEPTWPVAVLSQAIRWGKRMPGGAALARRLRPLLLGRPT
jgi:inositol phosphorylceramide mannosyltransferase catalytic subunit